MTCSCSLGPVTVDWTHVFTSKSTTNAFILLTEAVSSEGVVRVLSRLELLNLTTDMTVTFAYEYSDDLQTWTAGALGAGRTAVGTYDESSTDLATALFYRFGVYVKNTSSATRCESTWVRLRLDFSSF